MIEVLMNKCTKMNLAIVIGFVVGANSVSAARIDMTAVLPDAQPGQCFAKVVVPPKFRTEKRQITVREASEKIEIIPAKYAMVREKILVKPASTKIVSIPTSYDKIKTKIEISPTRIYWATSLNKNARMARPSLLKAVAADVNLDATRPGACFYEHYTASKFKTEMQEIETGEASEKIEIIPAKYEWTTKRVLVSEASTKVVQVPATYEKIKERILIEPARTMWKQGNGLIEKIDNATGDIMCMVEVPAKYKTITKRVLKTAARTKTIDIDAKYKMVKVRQKISEAQEIKTPISRKLTKVSRRVKIADAHYFWLPKGESDRNSRTRTGTKICKRKVAAKYKTLVKRVIKNAASTKTIDISAKYKTIKVRKMVQAPREVRSIIPAKVETVTKRIQIGSERLEWRRVLCETNTSKDIVLRIQKALKRKGFNPGVVDGILGKATLHAIGEYQSRNGIERGGLTLATLKRLGIEY